MTTCSVTIDSTFPRQAELSARLDHYFIQVDRLLLNRQDPITGLFPASTAITVHGDYTDAWVRDNVYSIQAVWGLSLAYRKLDIDNTRAHLLEQSVVRMMRGLLHAMMRQSGKVERFKCTQEPLNALHAKYNTRTGETVVADDKWGHLQLDATSIYLLILAQMTCKGLRLVLSLDEVSFIQNLVYYIGRTYRTQDYGIWERGNKLNRGQPEINASSVGMAKAALESIRGLNLFGAEGDARARIHVDADEIACSRAGLNALLPRESLSKEVDAALLAIIGYPAFAVDDSALAMRTREQVITKLAGPYGLKRFLLDGHQTVIEDHSRLHYEDDELKNFAGIESEWPLFYGYLLLDALFRHDAAAVASYRDKLNALAISQDGLNLLPELYYVPATALAAELAAPGSQTRLPNHNLPLVWAQSLFLLGELIADGLLACEDIDPLLRHQRSHRNTPLPTVHVAVVAETVAVKAHLNTMGIASQLPEELVNIRVGDANDLAYILHQVGRSEALQLSGRSFRPLGSLATAQAYRIADHVHLFFSQVQNSHGYYLACDRQLLQAQIRAELSYIARHWDQPGSPILLLKLDDAACGGAGAETMIAMLHELQSEQCGGVPIQFGTVSELLNVVVPVELAIDRLTDQAERGINTIADRKGLSFRTTQSCNELSVENAQQRSVALLIQQLIESQALPEQVQLMRALAEYFSIDSGDSIVDDSNSESSPLRPFLLNLYSEAAKKGHWAALRFAAGLLGKVHAGLENALESLVVRQRQVILGSNPASYTTVSAPLVSEAIYPLLRQSTRSDLCNRYDARECLLCQEILVYLAMIMRDKPELLKNVLSLHINELLALIVSEVMGEVVSERGIAWEVAVESLCAKPPYEVYTQLCNVLERDLDSFVMLKPSGNATSHFSCDAGETRWRQWRLCAGSVSRRADGFYDDTWHLLKHCAGFSVNDHDEVCNLLDSHAAHGATTSHELVFALQIEAFLNRLPDPVYRQLVVESLIALSAFFRANPTQIFRGRIALDTLLNNVVRAEWLRRHPAHASCYGDYTNEVWDAFYSLSPSAVADTLHYAVQSLLQND